MDIQQDFTKFTNTWLKRRPFGAAFQESANYLLENRGKYLRPMLVLNLASDLKQVTENHYWLALSLELHHNYTLIHDDLPCMDNDDMRRSKPTVHKAFGEAHALLLGDIFLAKSFELLSHIKSDKLANLIKIFGFATGAKGLILGQKIDLAGESAMQTPASILRMYELKTARLFQLALVGSLLLTHESENTKLSKLLIRLGSVSGILFQLLDDYEDWHTDKKSDFNFFRKDESSAQKYLKDFQEKFKLINNEISLQMPQTVKLLSKIY